MGTAFLARAAFWTGDSWTMLISGKVSVGGGVLAALPLELEAGADFFGAGVLLLAAGAGAAGGAAGGVAGAAVLDGGAGVVAAGAVLPAGGDGVVAGGGEACAGSGGLAPSVVCASASVGMNATAQTIAA